MEAMEASTKRVLGFDITRFIAVIAMAFVNYQISLAYGATEPPGLALLANLFQGRASALFVILAGVGLTMLNDRRIILNRAIFLLVVGYAWQWIWPGDILHFYGFYLLAGAAVLNCRASTLLGLALATITAATICIFALTQTLMSWGAGWDWSSLSYTEFWQPLGQLRNIIFNGWHPLLPWLAFLFLGMALGKIQITKPRQRRIAFLVGVASCGIAWALSSALSQMEDTRRVLLQLNQWWLAPNTIWGLGSLPAGPLYILSAAGSSVALLALILELTDRRTNRFLSTLATAGQYALTFYIAHIFFGLYDIEVLTDASQFPVGEAPTASELLTLSATRAVWFGLAAIAFSWLWSKRFRKGPLEWLMRRITG